MKYQTLLTPLPKTKNNQILKKSYHDKLLLLKLSRPSYTQGLIYVDTAYTLDSFLITLKEENFTRRNSRDFANKKRHFSWIKGEFNFASSVEKKISRKENFENQQVYRKKMNILCIEKMIFMPQHW